MKRARWYARVMALALAGGGLTTAWPLPARARGMADTPEHLRAALAALSLPELNGEPGVRLNEAGAEHAEASLRRYVAAALEGSPRLRALFYAWRAMVLKTAQAARLPEPQITYGYFLRSIETRVGPQRHRIGLSQSFPWLSKLSAATDAASAEAEVARRNLLAEALKLRQEVHAAYWGWWFVERTQIIVREQRASVVALGSSIRTRLSSSQTSLAQLNQIELTVSRLDDNLAGLGENARAAQARLRALMGADPDAELTVVPTMPPYTPALRDDLETLRAAVREHPAVAVWGAQADVGHAMARMSAADRLPSFTVGLDYIATDSARMPGVEDSGKDPVIVMFGAKVPLWQQDYAAAEASAQAQARAAQARGEAQRDVSLAALEQGLSELANAQRQENLYSHTLLPQAKAVYGSVVGSFASGEADVAALLLAQRDLLELEIGLARAQSQAAVHWVALEAVVGRPLQGAEPPGHGEMEEGQ